MKNRSQNKGFTLVEISVVLILFGIVVLFTSGVLVPVLRSDIAIKRERDIEKALDRLLQRVKMDYYRIPAYSNSNYDPITRRASSTWSNGREVLKYSNGYPVLDTTGNSFYIYTGYPREIGNFNDDNENLSICSNKSAYMTVRECLDKNCDDPKKIRVTNNVSAVVMSKSLNPIVKGSGTRRDPRVITILDTDRYDASFALLTHDRLRNEIGCNKGYISPRELTPASSGISSLADFSPRGYIGRTAFTFTVSHGWSVYWCIEWEHEDKKLYYRKDCNNPANDERCNMTTPTELSEPSKRIFTSDIASAMRVPVRGYCMRKARGEGEVDPTFISFGAFQTVHINHPEHPTQNKVWETLFGGYELRGFASRNLANRGVWHINAYISDQPDMSRIIDKVQINLVQ
jgi:prepilin-type N-terminal cleavage/methylation domain-containing protein